MSFSVLMVTYDGETVANLERCLESMQNQTLQASEIIICLDGEVRLELMEVLDRYTSCLPIKLLKNQKNGLAKNLNIGLLACSNDLVIRCDSDDVNLPERFISQVQLMQSKPSIVAASAFAIEQTQNGNRLKSVPEGEVSRKSMKTYFKNPINHHSCIYRRSIIMKFGYPEGRMEDFRLWSQLLKSGHLLYNTKDSLTRVSADNVAQRRVGSDYRRAELDLLRINFDRSFLGPVFSILAFSIRYPLRFKVMIHFLNLALKTTRKGV